MILDTDDATNLIDRNDGLIDLLVKCACLLA